MAQFSEQQLKAMAAAAAKKWGVNPSIFLAQIKQESGFNVNAGSSAGAEGIAQFMPGTAKSFGINPWDPKQALDAAAHYDHNELNAFGGDYHKALAAYNAGAGNANKWNDPKFAGGQTYNYVKNILSAAKSGGGSAALAAASQTPGPTAAPTALAGSTGGPDAMQALRAMTASAMLGQSSAIAAGHLPDQTDLMALALARQQIMAAHQTNGPTSPATGPVVPKPAAPATNGLMLPIQGTTGREDPHFLAALTAAAKSRGAVSIVVTSGERSAAHNAAVNGASHSNHLPDANGFGHAMDGYAVLPNGSRVPLGTFVQPVAGKYGLRSGATFQWGGQPDVVHVDDGYNQR